MLRRSPCEVYIKYLLLSEERYTNEQIIDMLVDANLDYLNQNYLNKLRQKLIPPEPFRPRDPRHTPSQKFLLREGLFSLFDRQEEKINAFAFSILDRPRAKEFVEALLISGTPPAAIAKRLFTMGVPRCPTAAVERYRYLFWNLSLIDSVDVKHLLHLRSQQVPSGLRGEERDAFLAAAKKASYHDPRMMAAQLPQSPAAALLVQAKMGLPVGKGDLKFFLESIFAQATGRLYVMLSGELPEAEMRAGQLAGVMRTVHEIMASQKDAQQDLRSQIAAITVRSEKTGVPTLKQLSGGNHTTEMGQPAHTSAEDGSTDGPDYEDEEEEEEP